MESLQRNQIRKFQKGNQCVSFTVFLKDEKQQQQQTNRALFWTAETNKQPKRG